MALVLEGHMACGRRRQRTRRRSSLERVTTGAMVLIVGTTGVITQPRGLMQVGSKLDTHGSSSGSESKSASAASSSTGRRGASASVRSMVLVLARGQVLLALSGSACLSCVLSSLRWPCCP